MSTEAYNAHMPPGDDWQPLLVRHHRLYAESIRGMLANHKVVELWRAEWGNETKFANWKNYEVLTRDKEGLFYRAAGDTKRGTK